MKVTRGDGSEVDLHCQIPFCPHSAAFPKTAPLLCEGHYDINSWGYFISPTLLWAILWVMALRLHELLSARIRKGEPVNSAMCTDIGIPELTAALKSGIKEFLKTAEEVQLVVPKDEQTWLKRFFTKTVLKAREFTVQVYCRLLSHHTLHGMALVRISQFKPTCRVQSQLRLSKVAEVIHSLEPVTFGSGESRFVLVRAWTDFVTTPVLIGDGTEVPKVTPEHLLAVPDPIAAAQELLGNITQASYAARAPSKDWDWNRISEICKVISKDLEELKGLAVLKEYEDVGDRSQE
jgi:hypothetical protein